MGFYGANYYGLQYNLEKITLNKEPQTVVDSYPLGGGSVVPFFLLEERLCGKLI